MSTNVEFLSQAELPVEYEASSVVTSATMPRSDAGAYARAFNQRLLDVINTVFLCGDSKAPRQVVFCGIDRDSVGSHICLELGRLLARHRTQPVCVINANPFTPQPAELHRARDRGASFGSGCELGIELEPNLWFVTADAAVPICGSDLPPLNEWTQWFTTLRDRFEYLIIDAPPVSAGTDAGCLARLADGLILIIDAHSTRKAAALKAKNALDAMGIRLLGSILNNRTYPIPEYLYRKL